MKWTTKRPTKRGHYWYKTRDIFRDHNINKDNALKRLPRFDWEIDPRVIRIEENGDGTLVFQETPRHMWRALDEITGNKRFIPMWSDVPVEVPESRSAR